MANCNCNTINYSSLPTTNFLNGEDTFLVEQGGVAKKIAWRDILAILQPETDILPAYKDHEEAAANGILSGSWWKAARSNNMGLPEGIIIQMP